MPTGYTSDIYHGKDVSFKDFVLTCARSRGALIHMRDEPLDSQIRKRDTSDSYHLKEIKKLNAAIEDFTNNPPTREMLEKEYHKKVNSLLEEDRIHNEQIKKLKDRYEKMLIDVKNWNPPTSEFHGLKQFMIEQLTTSIDGDCYEWNSLEHFPSMSDWVNDRLSNNDLIEELEYHLSEYNKECKSAENANAWIDTLIASLE